MEAKVVDLQHLVSKKTDVVEGETAGVAVEEKMVSQVIEDSKEVAAIGKKKLESSRKKTLRPAMGN